MKDNMKKEDVLGFVNEGQGKTKAYEVAAKELVGVLDLKFVNKLREKSRAKAVEKNKNK